jgi:hypothetical protein
MTMYIIWHQRFSLRSHYIWRWWEGEKRLECVFTISFCLTFWNLYCKKLLIRRMTLYFQDYLFSFSNSILIMYRVCNFGFETWNGGLSTFLLCMFFSIFLFVDGGNRRTRKNHRPVASQWQTLSHSVILRSPRCERDSNSQLQWW